MRIDYQFYFKFNFKFYSKMIKFINFVSFIGCYRQNNENEKATYTQSISWRDHVATCYN